MTDTKSSTPGATPKPPNNEGSPAYQQSKTVLDTSTTIIGETVVYPEGPARIVASIIVLNPGEATALHTHDVPLFAYILDGVLTVDYGEKGVRAFGPGDALVEAMDQPHQGRNLTDEPVRLLAVFIGADSTQNTVVD